MTEQEIVEELNPELEPTSYWANPVEIKAMRFTEQSKDRCFHFITCNRYADWGKDDNPMLVIGTLEGDMTASLGDYIVRGLKGEFYPVKPDIFEAKYTGSNPAIRSLPVPSEPSGEGGDHFHVLDPQHPMPHLKQSGEESESMKRLRAVAGDKVADACKRGMDKAMEEIRAEERASEKDRRVYYQDIVYSVCNLLDTVYTPSTCCGICTAPTTEVQDRVKSLIEYRDQQSEKYQSQIDALRTALRELAEVSKRMKEALGLSFEGLDDYWVTTPDGSYAWHEIHSSRADYTDWLSRHRSLLDGAPKKEATQ